VFTTEHRVTLIYEPPEILELGPAEEVTLGCEPTNPPDHCGCNRGADELELF
jgi:hypothetical protein